MKLELDGRTFVWSISVHRDEDGSEIRWISVFHEECGWSDYEPLILPDANEHAETMASRHPRFCVRLWRH